MLSYFTAYFLLFILSLSYKDGNKNISSWIFIGVIFSVLIGLRDQVGGDWYNYDQHFKYIGYYTLNEVLQRSDPGYYLINWLMLDWGYEIYAVNLICGIIFTVGLIILVRQQPNPWLAFSVAIPYLIVVVAMGYTRQAVAIGFVFWAIAALKNKHFTQFLILVALAATFHKSAVLMIGLGLFLQGNGRIIRSFAVIAIGFGIWSAFLAEYQESLWKNYIESNMQSQGAFIRVAMNFMPAFLFLIYRKKWKKLYPDYTFWLIIALGSVASIFVVGLAPTAIDRVSLYFTPIQIVVFARMPYLLKDRIPIQTTTRLILLFYLLVLYVWLNYATHSRFWVPYNNILFEGL
ncbi:MAG: EpsG family protein [Marinicellaceae bacterium]